MIIEHLIVCRGSSIDNDSNALSAFELVEDITITARSLTTPITIPLDVIAVFKRTIEAGEIKRPIQFIIEKPEGEPSVKTYNITVSESHKRHRLRLNLALTLSEISGDYKFTVRSPDSDEIDRSISFEINRIIRSEK